MARKTIAKQKEIPAKNPDTLPFNKAELQTCPWKINGKTNRRKLRTSLKRQIFFIITISYNSSTRHHGCQSIIMWIPISYSKLIFKQMLKYIECKYKCFSMFVFNMKYELLMPDVLWKHIPSLEIRTDLIF